MMRDMQGLMSPQGGMAPDQLAAGGGVDVQALVDQIEQAPPEILQLLKQIIDEKLATSGGGGGEALPPEQF
jgi:hypothetical protein